MLKILQARPQLNVKWDFQRYKWDLEKAKEPEIKLPTSVGSLKKKQNTRKTSISSLLITPKPLTVFSSVQSLIPVWLFATPWSAACQASLSITNSKSLLKLMSITSVMPSNHLILCHHLLLLPSIFPSIRVFSNESALCTSKHYGRSSSRAKARIQTVPTSGAYVY